MMCGVWVERGGGRRTEREDQAAGAGEQQPDDAALVEDRDEYKQAEENLGSWGADASHS